MRYAGFVRVFAVAVAACALASPASVSARRAHLDVCSTATGPGSRLSRSSPVFDNERGEGGPSTLGAYCGTPSDKIDQRLFVEGSDGTFYNVKLVFRQAQALADVEVAASERQPRFAAAARPGPTPLTWENDLAQQFAYLQTLASTGKSPCPNADDACLDFAPALANAAGSPALGPAAFTFPIGDLRHGRNGNPYFGVVVSSVLTPHLALPSASPATAVDGTSLHNDTTVSSSATAGTAASPAPSPVNARALGGGVTVASSAVAGSASLATPAAAVPSMTGVDETSTLTLFVGNTPYTIVTFAQNLGLQLPLTYAIKGRLGLGTPAGCPRTKTSSDATGNVQDFCTTFTGSDLAFEQSTSLGGEFTFCPKPSLPIPGAGGIALLTFGCHGSATLAYDVNVNPRVGYARIVPAFDLHIAGSLKANGVLISGAVDADLTVAKLDGSAGFIYGTFDDPFHQSASTLAYRPFAYYNATALPLDLTLSVRTFWGYRRHITFHLNPGFTASSPPLDKHAWSVEKL